MSNLNHGFSRNQRVSLTRIEDFHRNPFVVESLDYNYTILHGLERLEFGRRQGGGGGGDFSCDDFSEDDFNEMCMTDFSPEDFTHDDFY